MSHEIEVISPVYLANNILIEPIEVIVVEGILRLFPFGSNGHLGPRFALNHYIFGESGSFWVTNSQTGSPTAQHWVSFTGNSKPAEAHIIVAWSMPVKR